MNQPAGDPEQPDDAGPPGWFRIPDSFARPDTPLAGCRAKLDRAQEHLRTLEADVGVFLDEKPYGYVGEVLPEENDRTYYLLRADVKREPPPQWGVILGEYVHDLRSMLDQLVWQIIKHRGNEPLEGKSGFPIADRDWPSFERHREGTLKGCDPADIAAITQMQPDPRLPKSERRKHPLALLHWAWNEDKHRLLHPVYAIGESPDDGLPRFHGNSDAGRVDPMQWWYGVQTFHGHPIARFRIHPTGPNPKVELDEDVPVHVAFTKRLITPAGLRTIYSTVAAIFERFREEIEGDAPG